MECSFFLILNTGIREGERRRLKFSDVDFKNKRIPIRSSKAKEFRSVPMNNEVESRLRWLQENISYHTPSSLFPVWSIKWIMFFALKKAFQNACDKAGLKGVSLHTLRYTFASHLKRSGVDLRTVQKLLGHKNISTTMVYSHLTEDHLARGVEKLRW